MPVTDNLWDALKSLQDRATSRTLWVDAIRINQQDRSEKSQQLPFMGEIYEKASLVDVWLCGGGNVALNFMLSLVPVNAGNEPQMSTRKHREIRWQLDRAIDMEPPWYRRAWTVQEFIKARKVYFCFGTHRIPFDSYWNDFFTTQFTIILKTSISTYGTYSILSSAASKRKDLST